MVKNYHIEGGYDGCFGGCCNKLLCSLVRFGAKDVRVSDLESTRVQRCAISFGARISPETMKLVKEGYGFALVREGTAMESGLVTKRIMGIDWTVDTVMVFKIDSPLKSLPLVARSLKRKFGVNGGSVVPKKKPESVDVKKNSIQKDLFG